MSEIEKVNGKRELLQYQLPLDKPYALTVMASNVCNLACGYCDCSIKGRKGNKAFLDLNDFKKVMDDIQFSWGGVKHMTLVGLGEPLLHKNIAEFVAYAKEKKAANSIHIVSNGVFLTKSMSDKLIDAELDVLKISVNGLSDQEYEQYAGKRIDFMQLVENIRYFYMNKKKGMKVYVKIMEHMVNTEERRKKFYSLFEKISDVLNIEQLADVSFELNSNDVGEISDTIGVKGYEIKRTDICSMPFYSIILNAEGTFSACCIAGAWKVPPSLVMGNREDLISETWNNKRFNEFRLKMLKHGVKGASLECSQCTGYRSFLYPEDIIDEERENISRKIEEKYM